MNIPIKPGTVVPMKLAELSCQRHKRDPESTFGTLREVAPVVRVKLPLFGETAVVLRHEGVERLLKSADDFAVDPRTAGAKNRAGFPRWSPKFIRILTNTMAALDEPDHKRLRDIVSQAFSRRSMEALGPAISTIIGRALDDLEQSEDRDWVKHVARPVPMNVICEMLGLPQEDRAKFSRWSRSLMQTRANPLMFVKMLPAMWKMSRYLDALAQKRRADPRDDLITAIVQAEADNQSLTRDETVAMLFLLVIAGHETTVHTLGSSIALLTSVQHDRASTGIWDALTGYDDLKLPIEELLRIAVPFEFAGVRYARRDFEFEGVNLKTGDIIMPCLAAANFDPRAFDRPIEMDLARQPNPQLSFGGGPHFCVGVQLARMEADLVLSQTRERFPDLRASISFAEAEWNETLGLRGLKRLPVRLT